MQKRAKTHKKTAPSHTINQGGQGKRQASPKRPGAARRNANKQVETRKRASATRARDYCGCEWLNIPYSEQLMRKNKYMRELFEPLVTQQGKSCADLLRSIVPMKCTKDRASHNMPRCFRHKVATPFAPLPASFASRASKSNSKVQTNARMSGIACGFFEPGTHHIIPCDFCPSEVPCARKILNFIAKDAARLGIKAYNENTQIGILRHAILRYSRSCNEIMLVIVTRTRNFAQKKLLVQDILSAFPHITTIVQNVNPKNTNAMLGSYNVVLFGSGKIHDKLLGCTFEIGPVSFFQTNPEQTEILYQTAIDGVKRICNTVKSDCDALNYVSHGAPINSKRLDTSALERTRGKAQLATQEQADQHIIRIMDAYCGCGTIGICVASQIKNAVVIGFDQVEDSIERAKKNRRLNHLKTRCVYSREDATRFMQDFAYANNGVSRFKAIIMDPPRAGSTPEFIKAAASLKPLCIAYISCNPQTQVRDLAEFYRYGYRVESITPVDMFPHTPHVESVVLMSRVEGK
ncbi:class I SAM-dependent RNA methyltransferase [Fannyhessea vaginae]|uniref:class I SAM-dependent RNA methyltransferase n=1 Tax=Fannyhessea vaginae TaxID=82135 RepID=UPI003A804E80